MTTFKINTRMLNHLCVGLYNSFIEPDAMIHDTDDNGDDQYNWDNFSMDKYKEFIANEFHDTIKQHGENDVDGLNITLTPIKDAKIYSPREYNFDTDSIELNVTLDTVQALQFVTDNLSAFDEYLKENYSSCSGFTSYTPNNYIQWVESFNNNNVQSVCALINYWSDCHSALLEDLQEQFISDVQDNIWNDDFQN